MAQTCSSLAKTLREVWTNERLAAQFDMRNEMNRQLYGENPFSSQARFTGHSLTTNISPLQINPALSTNPAAHKARVAEIERRLAAAKRGGKPSYRQRQARGRAAKGKLPGERWTPKTKVPPCGGT